MSDNQAELDAARIAALRALRRFDRAAQALVLEARGTDGGLYRHRVSTALSQLSELKSMYYDVKTDTPTGGDS